MKKLDRDRGKEKRTRKLRERIVCVCDKIIQREGQIGIGKERGQRENVKS